MARTHIHVYVTYIYIYRNPFGLTACAVWIRVLRRSLSEILRLDGATGLRLMVSWMLASFGKAAG